MPPSRPLTALAAAALLVGGTTAGCSTSPDGSARMAPRSSTPDRAAQENEVTRVLAVSLDGLNPSAIQKLGRKGTPVLHRLMRQGAATLNARSARELTETLPNHTGMITGRRVDPDKGGHGVVWNDERTKPRTVHRAAGEDVSSVFRVVDSPERDTALFAAKDKFSLFERSWDGGIDRFVVNTNNAELVATARDDLVDHPRAFTLLHLSNPDQAGHESGFMGRKYLAAVRRTDRLLGKVVRTINNHPGIKDHLVLIVTSDHGGKQGRREHDRADQRGNFRVPFIVWGPGVEKGAGLYQLNDDYRGPGKRRTTYSAERQPVRNGDLANLALDLLGLPAVPDSMFNADQDLDVNGG